MWNRLLKPTLSLLSLAAISAQAADPVPPGSLDLYRSGPANAWRGEPAPEGPPLEIRLGEQGSPHFDIGFGYVYSQWSKISSALKNGSFAVQVSAMREYAPSLEGGLGFTFLGGSDNSENSENIYAFSVDLNTRWVMLPGRLTPFLGLGLNFGTFRAWSLQTETSQSVLYTKHASGYLFGVTPVLGLRLAVAPGLAVEIAGNYSAYLASPANKAGGIGALATFSFSRR